MTRSHQVIGGREYTVHDSKGLSRVFLPKMALAVPPSAGPHTCLVGVTHGMTRGMCFYTCVGDAALRMVREGAISPAGAFLFTSGDWDTVLQYAQASMQRLPYVDVDAGVIDELWLSVHEEAATAALN